MEAPTGLQIDGLGEDKLVVFGGDGDPHEAVDLQESALLDISDLSKWSESTRCLRSNEQEISRPIVILDPPNP